MTKIAIIATGILLATVVLWSLFYVWRRRQYESLIGRRVFAFSGLADNDQFFAMLRGLGITIVGTRSFPDHYRYTPADVQAITQAAAEAGAERIATTEKDAVKIGDDAMIAVGVELVIDRPDLERILAPVLNQKK